MVIKLRITTIFLSILTLICFQNGRSEESGLPLIDSLEKIATDGGRVAWYKGDEHDLIAFDSITDPVRKNTELYTIEPDGSNKKCVTCNSVIPKGFVGQPAWHPNGEYIVIQVENENSQHTLFNHMSWGINNDLWIVRRDGTHAELIHKTPLNHATLHPHFNADGTKIIFAERIPTGKSRWFLKRITPGGENQWEGWQIDIADFNIRKKGTAKLSNRRKLFEGAGGFYETHGFTKDGKIIFSHTSGGKAYVDDIYISDLSGKEVKKLIDSPKTWDEHGLYAPSGKAMVFNSSRGSPSWQAPRSKPKNLELDLYIKTLSGEIRRLTNMSALGKANKRYITSDFDWDKTGTRIVFQVATFDKKTREPYSPEIWILTFKTPQ